VTIVTSWPDLTHAALWLEIARGDLATWIQLTPYVFAVLEGVHLVGVAFFFGSIFLLDLRLLGLTPRLLMEPAGRFLLRISVPAFAVVAVSGALLFVPSADRYVASGTFLAKMGALVIGGLNALAFHIAAWRRVDDWGDGTRVPWAARTTAVFSVAVWLSVIALGRSMGYERREAPEVDVDLLLRQGQALHDFDGVAGEDREVWVILEQPRGGCVRLGLHDHVSRHAVPDVRDSLLRSPLRLSQRSTLVQDRRGIGSSPVHPCLDARSLERFALDLVEVVPLRSLASGLGADVNGQKSLHRVAPMRLGRLSPAWRYTHDSCQGLSRALR
jgi:hypothetical protein